MPVADRSVGKRCGGELELRKLPGHLHPLRCFRCAEPALPPEPRLGAQRVVGGVALALVEPMPPALDLGVDPVAMSEELDELIADGLDRDIGDVFPLQL